MSPIAVGLDLLLVVLLAIAVVIGLKLNKRLKGLRDGQDNFVRAVRELDVAAARAEAGLNALRAAQDQTHDGLLTRIETARGLITRLEAATTRASGFSPQAAEAPAAAPLRQAAPVGQPEPLRQSAPLRQPASQHQAPPLRQPAPVGRPAPPLRPQAPAFAAAQAPRTPAREIDDDLFEDNNDRLTMRRSQRR